MSDWDENGYDKDGNYNRQADDVYWENRAKQSKLDGMTSEQRHNNPEAKPMGHFTGRCGKCGSSDLWDDNLHYGCNSCGAFLA